MKKHSPFVVNRVHESSVEASKYKANQLLTPEINKPRKLQEQRRNHKNDLSRTSKIKQEVFRRNTNGTIDPK